MATFLKQTVGIDVAQKELVVSLGRIDDSIKVDIYAYKVFSNTPGGITSLISWVASKTLPDVPVIYAMEATGVYHEKLAHYLADNQKFVSIILPNKISNYVRTIDVKTITDKTASEAIARFALERNLEEWEPAQMKFTTLRQLTRERDQLVTERTLLKNQLHAEMTEARPNPKSISRVSERIKMINLQEKEIKEELADLIKQDQQLTEDIKILTSIPGIGALTAAIILGETNGFQLIKSQKQLVSYAGLDVIEKTSGTSVRSKTRISKKGNRNLRKALYFPALSAIGGDERFKGIFARLVSKHGIKMKAGVAIQRKLLELTFTLWKSRSYYDKEYFQKETTAQEEIRAMA